MVYRLAALLSFSMVSSGCGRLDYEVATAEVLVVTVTDDRMAGPPSLASTAELASGTDGLSLREALAIASNRRGADSIAFDPLAFPPGTRGTIVVGSPLPALTDPGTEVHGADGVSIDASALATPVLTVRADRAWIDGVHIRGARGDAVLVEDASEVDLSIDFTAVLGRSLVAQRCTDLAIADGSFEAVGQGGIEVIEGTAVDVRRNRLLLAEDELSDFGIRFLSVTDSAISENFFDDGTTIQIDLQDSSRNEVSLNTLDGGELRLGGASSHNRVLQNLFIWNPTDCVLIDPTALANVVVHNTLFTCPRNAIVDRAPDTMLVNNLATTSQADFVDPLGGEFRLSADSMGVDAGTDLGYDVWPNGPELFLGAAPDLGAIETR